MHVRGDNVPHLTWRQSGQRQQLHDIVGGACRAGIDQGRLSGTLYQIATCQSRPLKMGLNAGHSLTFIVEFKLHIYTLSGMRAASATPTSEKLCHGCEIGSKPDAFTAQIA